MIRTLSSWQEACAAALSESDERKVVTRIGCATAALEVRFAEWGGEPGSPEELKAILELKTDLDRVLAGIFQ